MMRIIVLCCSFNIVHCFFLGLPHALPGLVVSLPLQHFMASFIQPDTVDLPQLISDFDVIAADDALKIVDSTFKEAILPEDFKDVVAIFVSEFAAGGIAGLAQKETALLDGNKDAVDANKDTFLAIAETNGLFFALRGGLKAAAQLLGITTGVASVVTLLLAITFSEEFKILSRRSSPLQTLLPVDLKDSATSVFGANITTTEVLADVTKWITYDVSIESLPETFYSAIGCGALAGITSQLFREFGKGGFNSPTIAGIREVPIVRIARAAVEGTVQFVAYEASRQWLFPYIPDINPYIPNINPLSLTLEDMSALVLHTIPPS